jgi:hypothetical protein
MQIVMVVAVILAGCTTAAHALVACEDAVSIRQRSSTTRNVYPLVSIARQTGTSSAASPRPRFTATVNSWNSYRKNPLKTSSRINEI